MAAAALRGASSRGVNNAKSMWAFALAASSENRSSVYLSRRAEMRKVAPSSITVSAPNHGNGRVARRQLDWELSAFTPSLSA
ncbi:MAG: hypothetical protein KDA61_17415 [Planctomycetales bacterium]|nr:hypothetical protein [Planctomycetales bacterium]